jgi:NAD(P)-dependent dehydrogenase (short-subunit alcohol dehydrogenase family)
MMPIRKRDGSVHAVAAGDALDLSFDGRVAVVTGGASGIARATTELLVARGAQVVTADLDISGLVGLDGVTALQLDLLDPAAPARLVDAALQAHGRVDVLANVLGAAVILPSFLDTTDESWQWHFDINLNVAVRAARAALPAMVREGKGAVVNVSSEAGREPIVVFAEYSAAKGALIAWSKTLANEFGPAGIRVNTVCPGTTRTPGAYAGVERDLAPLWGVSAEEAIARYLQEKRQPIARLCEPEEVAAAIAFLCSDAAAMITGAEIRVDGGAGHAA